MTRARHYAGRASSGRGRVSLVAAALPGRRRSSQAGVTLIELIIAITLVAAIAGGMLTAMQTSLASLQKTQGRLEENRRTMAVQQTILRQIGSLIPVMGECAQAGGGSNRIPALAGTPDSLHLVTAYSLAEGFRGYPRIVHLQVRPESGGTVRLLMNEFIYSGPASLAEVCAGAPFVEGPQTVVLATGLAFARFFYHERIPGILDAGAWLPGWNRIPLPSAIRFETMPRDPNPSRLPMVSLHIPIRITREMGVLYGDQ